VNTPLTVEAVLQFPETKSYPFPVWSGLLTADHYRRIGPAIWVFLWFLDRVTSEEEGWGVVLGGKPIKDCEIAARFGVHPSVIRDNRRKLVAELYVEATRTPRGFRFRVRNSRKFIWKRRRSTENRRSLPGDRQNTVDHDRQKSVDAIRPSSKDLTKPTPNADWFDTFWKAYPKKQAKVAAWKAWSKIGSGEISGILAGIEAAKQTDQWKRGFIPNPATFLNGRRWEDELSPVLSGNPSQIPTASELRPRR
jgi:hypothetical protein